MLTGRSKTVDFNVADALLCKIGRPHLWYSSPILREHYEALV
jgi:hypothetical protein